MLSNTKARDRIDAINELIANHRSDQERGQFKVTPYDVVRKGFIPDVYSREFDRLMDEKAKLGEHSESSLTLPEQLSYATYFAMYPEKVCGVMEVATSGAFSIRVRGTRADVERVIGETLKGVNTTKSLSFRINNVEIDDSMKGFIYISFVVETDGKNYPHSLSFTLDKDNQVTIGDDSYPNWRMMYVSAENGWVERPNYDKDKIRKYLDNPQIEEILTNYYPKVITNPKPKPDSPMLNEKSVKLYNLKFIKNTDESSVHFSFESDEPNALVEMRIELDDDNCMKYLAETDTKFFQYRSVQVKEYSNFSNAVRINKSPVEIKQYLDNPQIKEFLKDYYPKTKTLKNSFKYKLRSRPCGIGCQPDGFINYSEMDKRATGFFGELTYDRELTENEIYKFELMPSNTPDPQKNKEVLTEFKVEQQSESFFDFSFFDNQFDIKLYMTVLFMPDGSVDYQPYMLEHRNGKGYDSGDSFKTVNEESIPYYLEKDEIKKFLKPVLEKVQSNRKRQRRIRVATATAIALALAYNYKND